MSVQETVSLSVHVAVKCIKMRKYTSNTINIQAQVGFKTTQAQALQYTGNATILQCSRFSQAWNYKLEIETK